MKDVAPPFTLENQDKNGLSAPVHMIGIRFHHAVNQQIYTITGVTYMGELDEWGFEHKREGSDVKFTRSVSNFLGKLDCGVQRFRHVLPEPGVEG